MRAYERLLQYVVIHTTSDPDSGQHPSTQRQFELANLLAEQLRKLNVTDAFVDEHCYVYGHLNASAGCENLPSLGLIAHLDTSDAASGENVKPQLHPDYDGKKVWMPGSKSWMEPERFPDLLKCRGETLITTDGTTLLGADDKAGIAEILTALEELFQKHLPHPRLCIAFTPDEEIGQGAQLFDLKTFDAPFAYTVDGGDVNEAECENFNAASTVVTVHGVNVHPGSAKNTMRNAQNIAMEFHGMLPPQQRPEHTEQREGFYHLCSMQGTVGKAQLGYIVRDHDRTLFEERKEYMQQVADFLNSKYGEDTVELQMKDSYYNMQEIIRQHWHLMENAQLAIKKAGLEPSIMPVRGGTDGASLSFKGLPCPNLGTGGFNFHGEGEFITAERMDRMVQVLLGLIGLYAEKEAVQR